VDYAPWGVPDFDQQQADWHAPAQPSNWTHGGPVAVADVLWWLDSRSEPGHTPPPTVSDGYPLIAPAPQGGLDDHDPGRVVSLVNDLASRLDTNGARSQQAHVGTQLPDVVPALRGLLTSARLESRYGITLTRSPTFEQLLAWARQGDGVVIYLGLWEDQGADKWVYLGGHYVALAGIDPLNRLVALSDPLRDAFEQSETLGRSPAPHQHVDPHAFDVHNDAQYVSHDAYRAVESAGPDQALALEGYTAAESLIGQNLAPEFLDQVDLYGGASIQAKLDYAVTMTRATLIFLPVLLKLAR
jgi:hypothetical protein